jgi:hypothetical protein
MATAAQIEANRQNAQKSTGPRTGDGKKQSRRNALNHGCRATRLVMPHEDPSDFEIECHGWKLSIRPRNPTEEFLIERIVSLGVQARRIERAQTARLTRRMHHGLFEEDALKDERVVELGQKLFRGVSGPRAPAADRDADRPGPDPDLTMCRISDYSVDEDQPMRLILGLKASLPGCEWLLEQWAGLRDLLERGVPWLASDKLKAARLLGRHPLDARDEADVARVYLACHVLYKSGGSPFQEIVDDLPADEAPVYEFALQTRLYDKLMPKDPAAALRMLRQIIDAAVDAIEDRASVLRELDEVDVQTAGARFSWDDTHEGERLRRYELTCERAWHRTFDLLMRVRRDGTDLEFATIMSLRRSVPVAVAEPVAPLAPPVAEVRTPPAEPVKTPDPPAESSSPREKLPNEPNSHVHASSRARRDEPQSVRIDAPQSDRQGVLVGKSGAKRVPHTLLGLETKQQSPLLNLPPNFGEH